MTARNQNEFGIKCCVHNMNKPQLIPRMHISLYSLEEMLWSYFGKYSKNAYVT